MRQRRVCRKGFTKGVNDELILDMPGNVCFNLGETVLQSSIESLYLKSSSALSICFLFALSLFYVCFSLSPTNKLYQFVLYLPCGHVLSLSFYIFLLLSLSIFDSHAPFSLFHLYLFHPLMIFRLISRYILFCLILDLFFTAYYYYIV